VVEALLLIAGAGYWFGNTGAALAALWLAARPVPLLNMDPPRRLDDLQPVWVSPQRVLLRGEDGRRIEIFRDEMTAQSWAALKRRCLNAKLE
jgi:hypothetical protein